MSSQQTEPAIRTIPLAKFAWGDRSSTKEEHFQFSSSDSLDLVIHRSQSSPLDTKTIRFRVVESAGILEDIPISELAQAAVHVRNVSGASQLSDDALPIYTISKDHKLAMGILSGNIARRFQFAFRQDSDCLAVLGVLRELDVKITDRTRPAIAGKPAISTRSSNTSSRPSTAAAVAGEDRSTRHDVATLINREFIRPQTSPSAPLVRPQIASNGQSDYTVTASETSVPRFSDASSFAGPSAAPGYETREPQNRSEAFRKTSLSDLVQQIVPPQRPLPAGFPARPFTTARNPATGTSPASSRTKRPSQTSSHTTGPSPAHTRKASPRRTTRSSISETAKIVQRATSPAVPADANTYELGAGNLTAQPRGSSPLSRTFMPGSYPKLDPPAQSYGLHYDASRADSRSPFVSEISPSPDLWQVVGGSSRPHTSDPSPCPRAIQLPSISHSVTNEQVDVLRQHSEFLFHANANSDEARTALNDYAVQSEDERMQALNSFIVDNLNNDDFAKLCGDVDACWRRIALEN